MNAAEIIKWVQLSSIPPFRNDDARGAILATLDAIRELPAEITDSSVSAERDFAIRWYARIDALKRKVAG